MYAYGTLAGGDLAFGPPGGAVSRTLGLLVALVVAAALLLPVHDTVAAIAPAVTAFRHPGVLVDRAQLDLARQKALAGIQPWKSAYDAMRTSRYASLSWTPRPRADVDCGQASNPDNGCSDERNDAIAAY